MFRHGSAPTWLYSFLDLAFLFLIVFSQINVGSEELDLGEIQVPQVSASESESLPDDVSLRWQVRVYPPTADAASPFALARTGGSESEGESARLRGEELAENLARLSASDTLKPLLAPHELSLSGDLLEAVALIERHWPTEARATIAPVSALR